MPKRINSNRVKVHRNYSVSEAAELLEVHKRSVREWIKNGLPVCDSRKPTLILGSELKAYLQQKRQVRKTKCGEWELFCLRCRKPSEPLGGMLNFQPLNPTNGCLTGLCPHCEAAMNRYAKVSSLSHWQQKMDVTVPAAFKRISDSY